MNIAEAKQILESRKIALQSELDTIQVCLDTLDTNVSLEFPNIDLVVKDKNEALVKIEDLKKIIDNLEKQIPLGEVSDEVVVDP